jgi:hypothetical protein
VISELQQQITSMQERHSSEIETLRAVFNDKLMLMKEK